MEQASNKDGTERIQKIICNAGYCSRRKAEELIQKGYVTVNDKVAKIGEKASEADEIKIFGKPLAFERKRYLMLNKPKGYITTVDDPEGRQTVMELIDIKERVYPIGRLDGGSEGLLLLTNDGEFANLIMHPRYEIRKTYHVKTDKAITDNDLKKMEKGIVIEEQKTSEAKTERINDNEFYISIHEGRNRIIRKMLEALGYGVQRLVREKIGKLSLGSLKYGKFRDLTEEEMERIFYR
jgi:23S rRNA pseudouridine2605 synthase